MGIIFWVTIVGDSQETAAMDKVLGLFYSLNLGLF